MAVDFLGTSNFQKGPIRPPSRGAALRGQQAQAPQGQPAAPQQQGVDPAMQAWMEAEADRMAQDRLKETDWSGTGLIGSPVAAIRNRLTRGSREESARANALRRLETGAELMEQGQNPNQLRERLLGQQDPTSAAAAFRPERFGQPDTEYEVNPETGQREYVQVQYGDQGTRLVVDADTTPTLTATMAQADPEHRGLARVEDVEDVQALMGPESIRAGMIRTAQEDALTEATLERQARLYDQESLQELESRRNEAWSQMSQRDDMTEQLSTLIGEAKDSANWWTTGLLGAATRLVPGTDTYDMVRKLDTVRAVSGLDRLQQLREAGGTLGQVTEAEHKLLQDAWANINNAQSADAFRYALDRFQSLVNDSWGRVNKVYEEQYGTPYFSDRPPSRREVRNSRVQPDTQTPSVQSGGLPDGWSVEVE